MSKKLTIVLVIISAVFAFGGFVVYQATRGMKEMREFVLPTVNATSLTDGNYNGKCSIGRWGMQVAVTIKAGKIVSIGTGKGTQSNLTDALKKELDQRIILKQSPDVDAAGGATITSKAYMIAVADALKK